MNNNSQFQRHQFMYIDNTLYAQMQERFNLLNDDDELQLMEEYVALLKEYGGRIRKELSTNAKMLGLETLAEATASSSLVLTNTLLMGTTELVKDKYSCPTPSLCYFALLVAHGTHFSFHDVPEKVQQLFADCIARLGTQEKAQPIALSA